MEFTITTGIKQLKTLINETDDCSRRCPKCKSKHLNDGYWTRGWNDLCSQACGDTGIRCFDCCHIEWEQTLDEYKAKLPKWCRAYCT